MRINIAHERVLDRVLGRKKREAFRYDVVDLKAMLRNILVWADRFVPSESGSILLDDPTLDEKKRKPGLLCFVASFGKNSAPLAGTTMPVSLGIAGRTYSTGKPYI